MEQKKKNYDWVSLHTHTGYSLLDGSAKIKDLIAKAKALGMKSMAITDHGVMYGCVEFYKEAKAQGIKPIIGCEVYLAAKSRHIKQNDKENEIHHLVLLAKNQIGYSNLMKIVSNASIEGFYYKPRTDHEFLKNHSEGIIALSACLGGEVQSHISNGNIKKAEEKALLYKDIFKEDFYLELQYHGIEGQLKVNDELVRMSKELDIPLVATNDVHYINKEDYRSHDILLCIQTAKTVDQEDRMKYPSDEFYLKSPEEMYQIFAYIPEALENTVKISNQCNFDYEFHVSKLPKFPLPLGTEAFDYLQNQCYQGLIKKYKQFKLLREQGDIYSCSNCEGSDKKINIDKIKELSLESGEAESLIQRLEYELSIIKQMGYVDYFLIVWDFIRFADENGIITGPGRGSAAGSIIAYALNITKIDPIKYGLIFERFLNPDRVSMPDIDSDFCYERRQEVIDYVVDKYGTNNVSQIITFGTMAARACIRDVGRAMNYSYAEVDKIAKMIPTVLTITISKALELNPELKEIYELDERVKDLIDISLRLEGLPRHSSTHAAGVVIASQPLVNYVPLQKNDESIVTQFTMNTLEELGLLKMDFLGLRTLTVMRDAIKMIKENRGIEVILEDLDFEDDQVYKMISEGKTVGVFQLESPGMTSFMKELKPDCFEDIIAGISLYRPGPMAEIPRYVEGKRNPEKVEFITEELEDILSVTYGCMVYQEQVMEIVRKLAGYSMGRSDLVRRAMSKKKYDVMEKERQNFIHGIVDEKGEIIVPGCVRNGINEEKSNKIFDQMMDFASYAFNKSHAASYAVVGYQTAYLMKYYPTEFIAAMLNSVMNDNVKIAFYLRFVKEFGIQLLPPTINESYAKFTVSENQIRFGLSAIKNVGINIINSIVKSREEKGEFSDLNDFCNKIDLGAINKRTIESLIKAGAFDCFLVYRSKMLAVYERIIDGITSRKRKNIQGQVSLFDEIKNDIFQISYPNIGEFEKKHLLAMEKEMTGLYISGHPLDEYERTLKNAISINISDIVTDASLDQGLIEEIEPQGKKVKDGDIVIIGGIITSVVKKTTKNNEMMAFVRIEDLYTSMEVVVFPRTFAKFKSLVEEDNIVLVKGRVSIREEEQPKLLCEVIDPLIRITDEKLYILVQEEKLVRSATTVLKKLSIDYRGNVPIFICTKQERKKFMVDREYWVSTDAELMTEIRKTFGQDNVKIV